VSVKSDSHN